jgi:hypothetical protein
MATSKTSKKAKQAVTISAPKIVTAWTKVCATSGKAEGEIIAAIENLSAVLVLESGLSVADMKKVVKDTGKESSFIKASHVPALQTWSKLRSLHADFKALPIAKQLSTAMASYDILGAGKGEQYKTLEILQKEIAGVRKAKQSKTPKTSSTSGKVAKTPADTLASIRDYFTALDTSELTEDEQDILSEIQFVIEGKMANA